jgi:SOS-response transcriptional repressor LexA
MKTLGSRIAHFRKIAGISQADLAKACGWKSQSRIGNYERDTREPTLADLALIAKALRIDQAEIMMPQPLPNTSAVVSELGRPQERNNVSPTLQPYREVKEYPLISWVAAGSWAEACDTFLPGDAEEWIESDERAGPHGYWLKVGGESMMPPTGFAFTEGMRILVQPEGFDLISGKFYIAKLLNTGETTFKQYVRDAGVEYLRPLNPSFKTMEITDNVRIIGRVIDARPPKSMF